MSLAYICNITVNVVIYNTLWIITIYSNNSNNRIEIISEYRLTAFMITDYRIQYALACRAYRFLCLWDVALH